jgi:hypothetical protein
VNSAAVPETGDTAVEAKMVDFESMCDAYGPTEASAVVASVNRISVVKSLFPSRNIRSSQRQRSILIKSTTHSCKDSSLDLSSTKARFSAGADDALPSCLMKTVPDGSRIRNHRSLFGL